jgi:hypothetical protein
MNETAAATNAARIRLLANWLLGCGLALPLIAGMLHQMPRQAGAQLTGANLFLVMLALATASLLNKNQSVESKAKGRLLVAALCVLVALAGVGAAVMKGGTWLQSSQETALIVSMNAATERQANALAAIDRRMEAIDLDGITTPVALTSRATLEASRESIGLFKGLSDERLAQSRAAEQEYERLINQAGLREGARIKALAAFRKKSQAAMALVNRLYAEHYQTVSVYVDLIDFAASRVGQIQVANNALVFAQDADRVRMDYTLKRLQAALTRLANIEARIATSRGPVAGK